MMTKGEKALKLGYQNSIKDVKKRRKGSINYDFARQRMVVRPSTFGGLLSFSKYCLDEETMQYKVFGEYFMNHIGWRGYLVLIAPTQIYKYSF